MTLWLCQLVNANLNIMTESLMRLFYLVEEFDMVLTFSTLCAKTNNCFSYRLFTTNKGSLSTQISYRFIEHIGSNLETIEVNQPICPTQANNHYSTKWLFGEET